MDQEVLKQLSDLVEENGRLKQALNSLEDQWKKDIKSRNELREQLKELGIEPRA